MTPAHPAGPSALQHAAGAAQQAGLAPSLAAQRHPQAERFAAFDWLASWVAVVDPNGWVLFANTGLQEALGLSWRALEGAALAPWFEHPDTLAQALQGARENEFAALRFDTQIRRQEAGLLPVHVIVAQTEQANELVVELLPLELHARQEREERLADQAKANKELFHNLAHEIKNPLGGIRGAAQLLEMDAASAEWRELTQVIIHETDRLQTLVDRLLAPHRRAPEVGDVNIHQVCERVRALILAEFPRGLQVVRDYDISLPEFRGDREQLIQAVLNIAQNAALALSERRACEDGQIILRTRVSRQATIAGQRYRLALELHVIDNGPGVPDSIKERIFNPLVSGREGGTGLGLTLAQSLVQQHHGLIELDSRPGSTDFKILIPLP